MRRLLNLNPGQPGFAPATRIGNNFPNEAPARANWEQGWTQVPQNEGVSGLSESVNEIKEMLVRLEKLSTKR
jgi:hypothetical protein